MESFTIRSEEDWERVRKRMEGEKVKREFKIEIRIPEISLFKTDEEYKQFKKEMKIHEKQFKESIKWEKKIRTLEKKGKDIKGGGFEEALKILEESGEFKEGESEVEAEDESLVDYMR